MQQTEGDRGGDGFVMLQQQRGHAGAGTQTVAAVGPHAGLDGVAQCPEPGDVATNATGRDAEALGQFRGGPCGALLQEGEDAEDPTDG